MTKSRRHEFEDQTLVGFSLNRNDIRLRIKCWDDISEKTTMVSITFVDVRDLQIDSTPDSDIRMISEDGEIIHFETDDDHMLLIIVWHDRASKAQITKSYKFSFRALQIL